MGENIAVPDRWTLASLDELILRMTNGSSATQFEEKVGFPITRIETIWNETIDLSRVKYVKEESKDFVIKYALIKNDILFSHINSDTHLGKTAIFKSENVTLIHGINLLLLRPTTKIYADFINYQFKYKRTKGEFVNVAQKAVNQSSINQTKLKKFHFALPPLPEQHAIVSKIEQLFSELDKGVELLKTAQQQLKVYRQSVLKWAFDGKLTEKITNWINTTLGNIISISSGDGLTKATRSEDGEYLVYGGNGIVGKHSEYIYQEEKLIIGRVGVHCGNVHITKPKSWITDNAFVASFDKNMVDMKFLYHLIWNLNLNKYSSSTAQPVISQGKIYPIEISLPDKEEQHQIVLEIESRLSECDNMETAITTSLQQAEALRQSILKKAFEGRLLDDEELEAVRQDPTWEPAERLLERIRVEKAVLHSGKKGRKSKA